MLLSRSKDSCLDGHWLAPELCTSVWAIDGEVEEDLSTVETDDSLFWLEGIGRVLVVFSYLFGPYPSGFYRRQLTVTLQGWPMKYFYPSTEESV